MYLVAIFMNAKLQLNPYVNRFMVVKRTGLLCFLAHLKLYKLPWGQVDDHLVILYIL